MGNHNWCNHCGNHWSECTCHSNCEECACNPRIKGKCVFYTGTTTECLEIETGDNLNDIIVAIDEAICNGLPNPSGHVYIVEGCDNQIDVTTTVVGNNTTYRVCLDDVITDTLSGLQVVQSELIACCESSVQDITTGTPAYLIITEPYQGVYNIDFNPSLTVEYDGIVENDTTAATLPTGSGTTVVVKSFNHNYITNNALADKDSISFTFQGKIQASGGATDSLIVELFNATTATAVSTTTISSGFTSEGISSYRLEGVLDVVSESAGDGLFTLELTRNHFDNGSNGDVTRGLIKIAETVANIDYTNLTIRLKQDNSPTSLNSVDNRCRSLKVWVEKKI